MLGFYPLGGAPLGDDGQSTGSSIVNISGVARGGAYSAAAFVKRTGGTGTASGGGRNTQTGSKRITGTGRIAAAGAVSLISFRRAPTSATVATGSRTTAQAPKRIASAGVLSGAGFLIGVGEKLTGATAIAGRSAGGSFVIGTSIRRALSVSSTQTGSRNTTQSVKRASTFASSFAAGRTSSLSTRFSNLVGKIASGSSARAQTFKRVAGSGKIAGAASNLARFTPPPLPDVVNIAGRWLRSTGISGVVPGDVTLSATSAPITTISGVASGDVTLSATSAPIVIKGSRKQA